MTIREYKICLKEKLYFNSFYISYF